MDKVPVWKDELAVLRAIIEKTVLVKTAKWGGEVYTFNGRNVLGLAGFKNYFALGFYNGVFLKDRQQVLVNAQEGKTKALRQWRFYAKEDINEPLILQYIEEAIEHEEAGKVWKPEKSIPVKMPEEMSGVFRKNNELKDAFALLMPHKQKEYIEYIAWAKRDGTKLKRMERIIPMILAGIGLNDRYKK